MEIIKPKLREILIPALIGAGLYFLAHTTITAGLQSDYSGNELSLEAVQTLIRVNAVRYDD